MSYTIGYYKTNSHRYQKAYDFLKKNKSPTFVEKKARNDWKEYQFGIRDKILE